MQTPYVGQNIWFTPSTPMSDTDPNYAAIITKVLSETMVNVAWFDRSGNAHGQTSVPYAEEPTTGQLSWRNIVAPI